MSSMVDAKPSVGHIPHSERLRPSTEGKQYFKVELLVGEDEQVMLPFLQDHVCHELSIDYYVATLGLPFAIRVKLARPREVGALYGARVYIDSGDAGRDFVYKKWALEEDSQQHDKATDTAQADHYFGIPVGCTEHTIRGFYKSPTESCGFTFGKPHRGLNGKQRGLDELGTIRIAFSSVEKFQRFQTNPREAPHPRRAKIDPEIDEKVRLVAKPGRIVKDECERPDGEEAVLREDVIFERRLVYNSFEGFSTRKILQRYTHMVDFYKGMPLEVLLQNSVRKQAITAFFRHVRSARIDRATVGRIQQANDGGAVTINLCDANEFVRVEDIVHYICKSLSPAASFIICTGKEKAGNYGEKQVQRSSFSLEDVLQDYFLKERGLVSFFMTEPGTFDIEFDGYDETKRPKENYKVKFSVIELYSDEDSNEI